MTEEYNKLEAEELFNNAMAEVESAAQKFTNTLVYKQLRYKEQQSAVEIINYLGEFMLDYHLESMELWSQRALEDVLISIFPHKIVANISFFEKVEAVLVKFLEHLYYIKKLDNGLELAESVKKANVLMLTEVHLLLEDSDEEKLFELGEEMGLDTSNLSDLDRLYQFVSYFEEPKKKSNQLKIINIEDLKKEKLMMAIR